LIATFRFDGHFIASWHAVRKHPFADRRDQARILGERDKAAGRHIAELLVLPADQRFEAVQRAVDGGDHRLIMEFEFAAFERAAQFLFHHAPLFGLRVERGDIARDDIAALVLRFVERKVGVAGQRFDRCAVLRTDRKADAGADEQLVIVDHIGAADRCDEPLGEIFGGFGRRHIVEDHGKFVAAEAAAGHAAFDQPFEPGRNLCEQLVADRVAQRVIDRLEPVEVDHQQRAARLGFERVVQRARQILVQAEAIRQAGEIVEARHLGDLFGGRALFGDVRPDAAKAEELARFVEARRSGKLPPARRTVDRYRHDQVRKAFAPLHPFGHVVQAFGEESRFPGVARKRLQQRHAFDCLGGSAERIGEARRDMDEAAAVVGLPQPVGRGFLEFAEQQADGLGLFVQHLFGAAKADMALRKADAEGAEQEPGDERDARQLGRAGAHQRDRGRQRDGSDKQHAGERNAVRDDGERHHHQHRDRPHRQHMVERRVQPLQPEGRSPEDRRIERVAAAQPIFATPESLGSPSGSP
jgi:hypothetical protein